MRLFCSINKQVKMNRRILFSSCVCLAVAGVQAAPADRDTTKVVNVEEIVVVASPKENTTFRRQALSSTILSREQLEADQVTSIKHLTGLVPNFYMPDYGSRLTSAIYIRGIGSRINTPAVGLYVDNVPYLDKSAFDFNTYDIERIDVLRGPQSTLYGRNAMGGLIRVYTRNPFRYQGTQLSLGGATANNSYRASLTHYHRISDRFAFSAGGFYEGARGFFKNAYLDRYADPLQSGGGRMRAIWLPTENWKLDFTANYEYSDEGGYVYGLYHEDTGVTDPVSSNEEGKYRRGLFNAGLSATYQGNNYIFNSVTSYQRLDDRMYIDQDFSSKEIYTLEQKQRLNALTEELSLKSLPGKRWQWVTGAFVSYQNMRTNSPVFFHRDGISMLEGMLNGVFSNIHGAPPMSIDITSEGMPVYSNFRTPVTDLALFHRSTFNNLLVDGLSLTVGLRVDHERLSMDYDASAAASYNFSIAMGRNPLALTFDNSSYAMGGKLKNHYIQLLPSFSLKYDFNADNNIYATVSRGYRSGGYNIQGFSELIQTGLSGKWMTEVKEGCIAMVDKMDFPPAMNAMKEKIKNTIAGSMPPAVEPDVAASYYKPEYTWSYEVGTHLTLWNGKLHADLAAFCMDTRDQQIARMTRSGLGRLTVNAGRSRSVGAEAALAARFDRHWSMNASYGYTRATFTDYKSTLDSGDKQFIDYSDNTVPFVPRHTLNVGASYSMFLKSDALRQITFHAGYTGVGETTWNEANTMGQGFYGTCNANIQLRTKVCDIDLWGRNLTDRSYHTFGIESMSQWFMQPGKPRQFGIDLRFSI